MVNNTCQKHQQKVAGDMKATYCYTGITHPVQEKKKNKRKRKRKGQAPFVLFGRTSSIIIN